MLGMFPDFSMLLLHLLDCLLLARAASGALSSHSKAAAFSAGVTRDGTPGFTSHHAHASLPPSPAEGSLNLSLGGQQRLVLDLHVAEALLQLTLYVQFATCFNTQEQQAP
jgi:hypothetical protein